MNARDALPALLAIVMLAIIGGQTSEALRRSGTWDTRPRSTAHASADPYARMEQVLAADDTGLGSAILRDPFSFARAPQPSAPVVARPRIPAPPPRPVVTAILTDAEEARAVIRYEGISYSVKPGDLFAQFRVVSIEPDEVIVEDGRERIVLRRPKGE